MREDFSKAPPPVKHDTIPERQILVLGDAMADWLAYGLEDAYSDQPEMGIIRRHKTVSGLINYQSKGDPADWAAAAKGILATEKPDAIVVMLGLDDRVAMREPAADKSDSKSPDKKTDKKTSKPNWTPSLRTENLARNRMVVQTLSGSLTTSRSIPNCRRRTPPTMTDPDHRAGEEHALAERHL